jgi:hypothetical protein
MVGSGGKLSDEQVKEIFSKGWETKPNGFVSLTIPEGLSAEQKNQVYGLLQDNVKKVMGGSVNPDAPYDLPQSLTFDGKAGGPTTITIKDYALKQMQEHLGAAAQAPAPPAPEPPQPHGKDAIIENAIRQNAEKREKEGKLPLTEDQTKLLTQALGNQYDHLMKFNENFQKSDKTKNTEMKGAADLYTAPEKLDKLPEIVKKQEAALAKGAAGLEVKQVPFAPDSVEGKMGMKQEVISGELLKPGQAPAVVKEGEFKLPPEVAEQALQAVKKLGKIEVAGLQEAAFLDGNPNDLTDKEKAAMLLAKSAKIEVSPDGKQVTTTIDGKVTPEKFLETDGKNPDAVFEAAKLILAKTYGVEGGAETKGPEGQQAFVQAAKTPPATEKTG